MLHQITLENSIRRLREIRSSNLNLNTQEINRINFCITILAKMERYYSSLKEEICPYSFIYFGDELEEDLSQFSSVSDKMYINCARFTREMLLYYKRKQEVPMDLEREWESFIYDQFLLNEVDYKIYREYLINGKFDIDIINNYLGNRAFQSFINYEENVKNAEEKISEMNRDLNKESNYIKSYLKGKLDLTLKLGVKLDEYKNAFNFVGLYEGFDTLSKFKNKQKLNSFRFSIFLGLLLVVVPSFSIYFYYLNSEYHLGMALSVLSLELILIYFFRVVLNRLNALNTEIIQIELRKSLCQFIQDYAVYAKEIRVLEDGKETNILEKFESIIFSNIVSSSDKVPSTFDGLEQLSSFLKELKK